MARKTMAERYAAQRSNKAVRRRALPRLSDTATAVEQRERDDNDDDTNLAAAAPATGGTFIATRGVQGGTATLPRPQQAALPRRAPTAPRRGNPMAAPGSRVDYGYVRRDLRRIAITAAAMLILLIVLNLALRAIAL